MKELLIFIVTFLLILITYIVFVVWNKKALKKIYDGTEARYIKGKYKLDIKKIPAKTLAFHIALINSLIISVTLSLIFLIDNYLLMIILALILVISLIIILYHLLGKHYQKQIGVKKDV